MPTSQFLFSEWASVKMPGAHSSNTLNVKVDYLIICQEDSRMRHKRGVAWTEAIPVNFCEMQRSTKKLKTL